MPRKFHIGDRVQLTERRATTEWKRYVGTVTMASDALVTVRLDNSKLEWEWHPSHLELIEEDQSV